MAKKDYYRKVYEDFKDLCSHGKQPCSFFSYCKSLGVDYRNLRSTLGKEFQGVKGLDGYSSLLTPRKERQYLDLYENFKDLCLKGEQSAGFGQYCESLGFNRHSLYNFLHRRKLSIRKLQGYVFPDSINRKCQEIPFESVIFEEAGFLPPDGGNAITIKVNGQVSVSFPASTDIEAIAKFVKKLGKEVSHVGS